MKLDFKTYSDKVRGCYTGKNIGGTLGAPFECYRGVYNLDWFMQDISSPIPNDDVDLQLVWLAAVEREGRHIDSHVLAEYWETYVSAQISEYGTSKNNFGMGILPPLSGYLRNENRNSNGAWIRTEIWACLCAGNPALAANYAYYDACVDHSDEGVYAATFTAAVQAAAFFETDREELIDIGLSYIPEDCGVSRAVALIRQCYKNGDDWKTARKKLLIALPSSFGEMDGEWKGTASVPACDKCPVQQKDNDIPKAEHGYDAPAAIGIVLLGWYYGEGDFAKSVCLAVNCGEDSDCTAGTLGSVLGIIAGESNLPEKWKKACSQQIATCTLRTDNVFLPKTIPELCDRIVRQTPVVLQDYCRFGENGEYTIEPVAEFRYRKGAFRCNKHEDFAELLAEQGRTVRFHFRGLTVKVTYDDTRVSITDGAEKTLKLTFVNNLYTPQYLKLRYLGIPETWEVKGSKEQCVGLEHWHGSSNVNSIDFTFTPHGPYTAKTEIVLEISVNGRGEKMYVPLTFFNGRCGE